MPLHTDEKLLLALIGIALVIRWIGVAYWPSTAYDSLWVYAYEGKLYTLLGYIPSTIGYYPQFLPLQHTFLQLAVGGINDHAARAVLPWLHLGSIFAAYILGKRLFNRRIGIYVDGDLGALSACRRMVTLWRSRNPGSVHVHSGRGFFSEHGGVRGWSSESRLLISRTVFPM